MLPDRETWASELHGDLVTQLAFIQMEVSEVILNRRKQHAIWQASYLEMNPEISMGQRQGARRKDARSVPPRKEELWVRFAILVYFYFLFFFETKFIQHGISHFKQSVCVLVCVEDGGQS